MIVRCETILHHCQKWAWAIAAWRRLDQETLCKCLVHYQTNCPSKEPALIQTVLFFLVCQTKIRAWLMPRSKPKRYMTGRGPTPFSELEALPLWAGKSSSCVHTTIFPGQELRCTGLGSKHPGATTGLICDALVGKEWWGHSTQSYLSYLSIPSSPLPTCHASSVILERKHSLQFCGCTRKIIFFMF
jgi:hypothetical protein